MSGIPGLLLVCLLVMRTRHMAFDVCVYTKGGIVPFVRVRPEILINAE